MLRYKTFGNTGLRVSEICLGTMSFGQDWGFGADEETSHAVLDAYVEAGGNFLDTANKYHNGQTESFLGSWLADRDNRDEIVLATKYTLSMDHHDPNASGNHRKNLRRSVRDSLKRLGTDHIDLLWVHVYDDLTPWQETLRALDDLVRAGDVLYIGISDSPSWVVSASNVMAELRGWTPYVGLQVEYSLLQRTVERSLLPMAEHFGLSVAGWAPLAAGVLSGKYTRGDGSDSLRKSANDARGRTSERSLAIAREVDAVADELGCSSAQVAIAWVLAQGYGQVPIVGARKVSQIQDSLGASRVTLGEEHLARLDAVSRVELGFPRQFIETDGVRGMVRGDYVKDRLLTR
ncbi:MAG: aldo/keto reductase [Deltaproteobacteria bacterium]|nr:MAG: aldo/keto reductase [Deltaproteobacteria bacterium]